MEIHTLVHKTNKPRTGLSLLRQTICLAAAMSVLTACSDSPDPDTRDFRNYSQSLAATLTDGTQVSDSYTTKDIFSNVSSIPTKYNYSGSISGPYVLTEEFKNGARDGYTYEDSSGTEIIKDDLETFLSADARTITGTDEPMDLTVGVTASFTDDATVFDSATGANVGTESASGTFLAFAPETVTVPAGNFSANKIDYTLQNSITISGVTDTLSATGTVWVSNNEMIVKMTGVADFVTNSDGIAGQITALELVLTSFRSTPAAVAAASSQSSIASGAVTLSPSLVRNIVLEIKRLAHRTSML